MKKTKKVKIEFKKLYTDSILPHKAHKSDAGFDLYAHSIHKHEWTDDGHCLAPGTRVLVKCGFGMALPEGYEAQIRPRSGLALKNGISIVNSPGTIDAGYRDEVGVILYNTQIPVPGTAFELEDLFYIKKGDRIAQMVIHEIPDVRVKEVDELSNPSERGKAGFGSTGR